MPASVGAVPWDSRGLIDATGVVMRGVTPRDFLAGEVLVSLSCLLGYAETYGPTKLVTLLASGEAPDVAGGTSGLCCLGTGVTGGDTILGVGFQEGGITGKSLKACVFCRAPPKGMDTGVWVRAVGASAMAPVKGAKTGLTGAVTPSGNLLAMLVMLVVTVGDG